MKTNLVLGIIITMALSACGSSTGDVASDAGTLDSSSPSALMTKERAAVAAGGGIAAKTYLCLPKTYLGAALKCSPPFSNSASSEAMEIACTTGNAALHADIMNKYGWGDNLPDPTYGSISEDLSEFFPQLTDFSGFIQAPSQYGHSYYYSAGFQMSSSGTFEQKDSCD